MQRAKEKANYKESLYHTAIGSTSTINYQGSTIRYPGYETGYLGQPTTQVNSINVTLVLDDHYKSTDAVRQRAVLINTGAIYYISCTTSLQPHSSTAATSRRSTEPNFSQLQRYEIRHVTMHNNVAIPTTFIIADVSTSIMGLDTITKNNMMLELQCYSGYLSNGKVSVKLHYIGHHFYIKAAMVNGYYQHVDYTE
eukprot:5934832-Amphidinium_carterae.1